jgi:large subunit ribosomal protein L21e
LKLDPSVADGRFHPRFTGHPGEIIDEQGAAYRIEIHDRGKTKTVIAKPAHLRRQ